MYFFLYKALNGYINIDMSRYVLFYSDTARYPLREKDSLNLKKNYARTNTFKFSFFNRIVDMWNSLPFYVRSASSISSFKRGVINLTERVDYLRTDMVYFSRSILFSYIFFMFHIWSYIFLNSWMVSLSKSAMIIAVVNAI